MGMCLMAKYRHECTFEDCVKEFGEYPIKQYIENKSMIWAITNIANELAEKNRLKRLEMRESHMTGDPSEGYWCKIERELEDKA